MDVWPDVTMYEIETDDLEALNRRISERLGRSTARWKMADMIDPAFAAAMLRLGARRR